ncbi:MAG TPA: pyruvate, phosphate dikinase [Planctomycetota bacterium]|nr:pyruvate, phosphate dikinase [Planctomycetota bacterium]
MAKRVYFFGGGVAEGNGNQKELLGGKGAGLAEMTKIGLPVPAGFTITIDTCAEYYAAGKRYPKALDAEIRSNIARLEAATGKKLGDPNDPLLVSVRSGAARSMPGMMETILNLGLNDVAVEGMAARFNDARFSYDSYRRFIQMYATTAMGLSKEPMEEMLHHTKKELGIKDDAAIPAEALKKLCADFKSFYKEKKGEDFPQDPVVQLWGAISAVFNCWEAEKAVTYRRVEKLGFLKGTAVNVQQMVFGNKNDRSGTGVCFTRDPNTGTNEFYGDWLINAQGEDVVAGIRTPMKLAEMDSKYPVAYKQLCDVRSTLEQHYKDMQDLEFTVEDEKLYMLQCRTGKRSPQATFVMAADMVKEKLITKEDAVKRISAEDIERLFYPVIDPKISKNNLAEKKLTTGINAVPGAAAGEVVFNAEDAEELAQKGTPVILVRKETSPEDVGGMHAAQGILTATGGKTSHAAVVARGWGKCCVVGCEALNIDYVTQQFSVGNTVVKRGDFVTLDGSEGVVYLGQLPLVKPQLPEAYNTVMKFCDQIRHLKVRTNADTPYDAANAMKMGAEGIGLCRTEHMFFDTEERIRAIREMIVADTIDARKAALAKLLPIQREDFYGIFKAMNGLPVTIRLIDPPLHEFVPHEEAAQRELAHAVGVSYEKVKHRVEQLHEANPMLGHRGCRLCITYPEILEMQVRAIIEAAVKCKKEGIKVFPEIMHPLVFDAKEFNILEAQTRAIANEVIKNSGVRLAYMVGTMIEVPRAALLADEIAQKAEFFSFGTNDLTQMTMALSRDDAGRFLPDYVDVKKAGIFKTDPFQSLDQAGVGKLMKIGIAGGRSTRPNLKIGICGEHGGDPSSVKFCHKIGLNYVSCSPFRVPIARLAAAQAVVEEGGALALKSAAKKSAPAKKSVPVKKSAPAKKAAPKKAAAKKAPAKRAAKSAKGKK